MKLPDTEALRASVQENLPPQSALRSDLIAGLTFALVNIPQGIANALLAGVDPVRGLYTLMVGMPVGALFTGSVFMNVSTTSALSVAAGSALLAIPPPFRVESLLLLVVLVGVIQLLAGLFRLGTLLRFVSNSVMVGFTTGVSLIIILGQLAAFTGYDSAFRGRIASGLDTVLRVGRWSWPAVAVGGVVLIIILTLSRTRFSKSAYLIALLAGTLLATASKRRRPISNPPPRACMRPRYRSRPKWRSITSKCAHSRRGSASPGLGEEVRVLMAPPGKVATEIWKRNFLGCFITEPTNLRLVDRMGEDTVAWECDYPHSDSTWPFSPECLKDELDGAGCSDDEIEAITWKNVARFFNYDPFTHVKREDATVGALRAKARAAGVDVSETRKAEYKRRYDAALAGA